MPTKTLTRKNAKANDKSPIFVGKHLVADPRVCHGELTFRGTRVPVTTILTCLAKWNLLDYLRKSWPEFSPEAIEEAVNLAADILADKYRISKP